MLNSKIISKPLRINCLLKHCNCGKSFCSFSIQYSDTVLKKIILYNDLISQVISVVPLRQCLPNAFLKLEESLAMCEITAYDGSIMIKSISDMSLL